MEYYAIVSQGDGIPPLSEENDGGGTRASYMLIFKVASILCCMFIQIPIPKVSFNTPHSLSTTKILSYVNMYDYTSKSPTVSNKNNIQTYVLCIKSICITYQLLDTRRGINRINADQACGSQCIPAGLYSDLPTNWPGQQFRRSIPTVVVYTHLFIWEHTHILFMAHKQEDLIHPSLIYLIKIHTLTQYVLSISFKGLTV